MAEDLLNYLITNAYFHLLKNSLTPYFNELKNYRFSLSNPLFWLCGLVFLLILSRPWGIKKASFFCLIIFLVLLATTSLENFMAESFLKTPLLDAAVLKLVSLLAIAFVSLYYIFVRRTWE